MAPPVQTKFPDANGQCTMDCPADFVVDGATAPLVTLSEGTVSTGLTTDACPNEFIVEVDHPDQFFARGVASFGGSLAVGTPSQQSCAQTFTLSLADLPATTGSDQTRFVTPAISGVGLFP